MFSSSVSHPEDKIITISSRHHLTHFCCKAVSGDCFLTHRGAIVELDDKCFHPAAVSPSVSLLGRSEIGSARTQCQGDKLFCKDKKKEKKMEGRRKSKKHI